MPGPRRPPWAPANRSTARCAASIVIRPAPPGSRDRGTILAGAKNTVSGVRDGGEAEAGEAAHHRREQGCTGWPAAAWRSEKSSNIRMSAGADNVGRSSVPRQLEPTRPDPGGGVEISVPACALVATSKSRPSQPATSQMPARIGLRPADSAGETGDVRPARLPPANPARAETGSSRFRPPVGRGCRRFSKAFMSAVAPDSAFNPLS